jgi:hypothetical protein
MIVSTIVVARVVWGVRTSALLRKNETELLLLAFRNCHFHATVFTLDSYVCIASGWP